VRQLVTVAPVTTRVRRIPTEVALGVGEGLPKACVVNLDTLDAFDAGAEVDPDALRRKGLVAKRGLVKVLGRGELTKALTVRVHGFSASAKQAIEAAGGSVEVVPAPWGDRRPPARGNALTNR